MKKQDCLMVNEVFGSIQGEGILVGSTAQFVRFQGCNLKCNWCDTKYASQTARGTKHTLTPDGLLDIVTRNYHGERLTVLTGGEPLFQNKEPLIEFCQKLRDTGRRNLLVETNATIFVPELLKLVDYWSVCPKTPSSGTKWDSSVISKYLIMQSCSNPIKPEVYLKFVISTDDDLNAVKILLNGFMFQELTGMPVVLQPDNSKPKGIKGYLAKMRWLVTKIQNDAFWKDIDVRIIPQVHQLLWWRKEGV